MVAKNVRWGEHLRLQFRWEMFNALNTPQFGLPNQNFGNSSFGQVGGAGGRRIMQFGLKLYWLSGALQTESIEADRPEVVFLGAASSTSSAGPGFRGPRFVCVVSIQGPVAANSGTVLARNLFGRRARDTRSCALWLAALTMCLVPGT